jgi:hypothetical protein
VPQRFNIRLAPGFIGGDCLGAFVVLAVAIGAAKLPIALVLGQPSLCRLERGLRVVMVQISEQAERAVTSLLVDVVLPATIAVNDEAAVVADAPFGIRLFRGDAAKLLGRDLDNPAVDTSYVLSRKPVRGRASPTSGRS